jgi:anti-sigma regulatory factor (Ser/Thr protein kinase)
VPGNLPGRELTGRERRSAGTLDLAFDADRLADLRKAVLAVAAAAGLPGEQADEVMLAVHELAANAVRHGGGTGRAQVDVTTGYLRCQVSDSGPGSPDGRAASDSRDPAPSWPFEPGHGLWLVRNVADHLNIQSSQNGSTVTVAFRLPGSPGGTAGD